MVDEARHLRAELAGLDAIPREGPADIYADRRRWIINRLEEIGS